MRQSTDHPRVVTFERHRARLFGIAFRMLGSVEDAEDVVTEVFLRWHRGERTAIREPEGWLVAVTTRLAIDRLRRVATERARYAGTWPPGPIATGAEYPPDRRAELASDLCMAFLVMLERLGSEERAAFLLRDAFDTGYGEIADVLGKSEGACRRLVRRARVRVRGARASFAVPAETKERLLERFLAALEADDRDAMLALVAEDASWTSDGEGSVPATRRVVRGGVRIVRLVLGLERKWRGTTRHAIAWVDGEPVLVTRAGDRMIWTTSVETDGERLVAFHQMLDAEKLRQVEEDE